MVFTLGFFFSCGKMFFFFFLSSTHIKDLIIMKIEFCTLSEFFKFNLEKAFFFQNLKKKVFSKSNSENSERAQNSMFIIIWSLMCVEQLQKEKKIKNIMPHEKKNKGKYHDFT